MGESRFNSSRSGSNSNSNNRIQRTYPRIRHHDRNGSASMSATVMSLLSRKHCLAAYFFAIVTFSVLSLFVQMRNGALGLPSKSENNNSNLISVPNPHLSLSSLERRKRMRKIRKLVDGNDKKKRRTKKKVAVAPSDNDDDDDDSAENDNADVDVDEDDDTAGKKFDGGNGVVNGAGMYIDEKDNGKQKIVKGKKKKKAAAGARKEDVESLVNTLREKDITKDGEELESPEEKTSKLSKAGTTKATTKATDRGVIHMPKEDLAQNRGGNIAAHIPNHRGDGRSDGRKQKIQDGGNKDKVEKDDKKAGGGDRKIKLPDEWHTIKVGGTSQLQDKSMFPSDFVMNAKPVDVLGEKFDRSSLRRSPSLNNELPYLGVLLDAGRHYFPVEWIKRMIDVLSIMNYNLLHFRLTDDQTFNVQLESQPLLAYPTTLNNNTKVYSPKELRDIVKYAKNKGIAIVPEINIPGHSASWGGIPDLIIQCPEFICRKGYGIPLNVSHPQLRPVLLDVLKEVIDIFDNPPFLHLGGDEVNMAQPCFDEVGEKMFDYNHFEYILKTILLEINYDESQVIRWEMTYWNTHARDLKRAGKITHFWFRKPGEPQWIASYGSSFDNPMFLSSGLYFDTNEEDSAFDVYTKTKTLKHNMHPASPVLGIIGGTFELSTQFWLDRNVIGRLLGISMGVSNSNITSRSEFFDDYRKNCESIGFDDTMCKLYGLPPIRYQEHRQELKGSNGTDCVWNRWINNTCDRLTENKMEKRYKYFNGVGRTQDVAVTRKMKDPSNIATAISLQA